MDNTGVVNRAEMAAEAAGSVAAQHFATEAVQAVQAGETDRFPGDRSFRPRYQSRSPRRVQRVSAGTQTTGESAMQAYRRGLMHGGSVCVQGMLPVLQRRATELHRSFSFGVRGRDYRQDTNPGIEEEFVAVAAAADMLHAAISTISDML